MEEAIATMYWCHMCSQAVNPVMESDIKCPFCQSGFLEEMQHASSHHSHPFLMEAINSHRTNQTETDSDSENLIRRRHSAMVLQLLQGIQTGLLLEESERRQPVIFINPLNQTITIGTNGTSLGDYFVGPGFETLLQRLAENDPNRYGTPPAQKEAVEALCNVKIEEAIQCSVCLDDFEIGTEAKEMPCKHKFHSECLLPWLELHSSCPVCRYQLPVDEEAKSDSVGAATNVNNVSDTRNDQEGGNGGSTRMWIPWPFSSLFSSSSQNSNASMGSG